MYIIKLTALEYDMFPILSISCHSLDDCSLESLKWLAKAKVINLASSMENL